MFSPFEHWKQIFDYNISVITVVFLGGCVDCCSSNFNPLSSTIHQQQFSRVFLPFLITNFSFHYDFNFLFGVLNLKSSVLILLTVLLQNHDRQQKILIFPSPLTQLLFITSATNFMTNFANMFSS